jgi:nitric oxide reductase subunit B
MLALAVLVFCLRSLAPDAAWARSERFVRTGFWGMNVGLALMMAVDLFPAGVLQLWDVLQNGYWHARRLTYLMSGTFHTLEWARSAADTVFLVAGVVPLVVAVALLLLGSRKGEETAR